MDISSVANLGSTARLASASTEAAVRSPRAAEAARRSTDTVEVSAEGLQAAAETRRDLVDRVKLQIQSGNYESLHKLDAAIDRMMDDLRQ